MIDKQKIIEACQTAKSMAQASASLGMNFATFSRYAKKYGCYTPNQGGKGINKGKTRQYGFSVQDVIEGKVPQLSSYKVKRKLIKAGILKNQCSECGITRWNGKKISLELDHIDGNSHNHQLSNLRIICPNCHSQTETFRFKRGKK
jgi:Zn finger protein HypA/HybF involved in hydrogenase expression